MRDGDDLEAAPGHLEPMMPLPYDEAGHGRPIVLLHARPADRRMWRECLEPLADGGFRAIAVDLPGYGEAAGADVSRVRPWNDVLETIAHLGAARPILAGNSLGALVALQIAAAAPERVSGLVLVGFREHDQEFSPRLRAALADEEAGDPEAGIRAWLSPRASDRARARLSEMRSVPPRWPVPLPGDPWEERPVPAVPARVAVGEDDMPDFHAGCARLAATLNAGPVAVVPAAGHLVPLERPAEFSSLLLDFAAGLPSAVGGDASR